MNGQYQLIIRLEDCYPFIVANHPRFTTIGQSNVVKKVESIKLAV